VPVAIAFLEPAVVATKLPQLVIGNPDAVLEAAALTKILSTMAGVVFAVLSAATLSVVITVVRCNVVVSWMVSVVEQPELSGSGLIIAVVCAVAITKPTTAGLPPEAGEKIGADSCVLTFGSAPGVDSGVGIDPGRPSVDFDMSFKSGAMKESAEVGIGPGENSGLATASPAVFPEVIVTKENVELGLGVGLLAVTIESATRGILTSIGGDDDGVIWIGIDTGLGAMLCGAVTSADLGMSPSASRMVPSWSIIQYNSCHNWAASSKGIATVIIAPRTVCF
jgi:hypothetical protein